jgi:hypothetical protein
VSERRGILLVAPAGVVRQVVSGVTGGEHVSGGGSATTFGWAWLAVCLAFALHVADEAAHDFLTWYNPRALQIRRFLRRVPFPPTFTFTTWIVGLGVAVALLLGLTPVAFAGVAWLRPLAYMVGVIQVGNGIFHLVGTAIARRQVPGVLSAPVLLAAATWLLFAASRLA